MKTGYSLPYLVLLAPAKVYSMGAALDLRLTFDREMDESAASRAAALVTGFEVLASSGALAGAGIRPPDSGAVCLGPRPVLPRALEWTLDDCRIDSRATAILGQMFLSLPADSGLSSVALAPPGFDGRVAELALGETQRDVYPEMHSSIAPRVTGIAGLSEDILATAVFARHPDADEQAEITGHVHAWLSGAMEGYYPVAPLPPAECEVVYDGNIDFYDREMELQMSRFRCHVGALNGLANALAASEARGPRLVSLTFE